MTFDLRSEEWSGHHLALQRLASTLLRGGDRADDLVQSVWLAALERPPRVLSRSWLERVLRSRAQDAQRARGRDEDAVTRLEPRGPSPDAAQIVERLDSHRELVAAVRALDEPYRAVVWLRYFEDLAPSEIARRMELPVKTVKTRLNRALEQLRERLERRHGRDWMAALAPLSVPSWSGESSLPTAAALASGGLFMVKKLVLVAVVLAGLFGVYRLLTPTVPVAARPTPADPAESAVALVVPDLGPVATSDSEEARRGLVEARAIEPAPAAPRTGSLLVRVTWSDGEPAAGVSVGISSSPLGLAQRGVARAASDASGMARAEGLPAGPVRIVSDRGFASVTSTVVLGTETEVALSLKDGVEVQGVVIDSDGVAVEGAEIWLIKPFERDWLGGSVLAHTDERGGFRLRDVPVGRPMGGASLGAIAEGFAPSALQDLDLIDISNDHAEVEIVLTDRGGALAGRVLGPEGEPLSSAWVAVGQGKQSPGRLGPGMPEVWTPISVACDSQGRFRAMGLAAGRHPVAVYAPGLPLWSGEAEVEAGRTTEIEIALALGVTVAGTVLDTRGEPVAGAVVRAFDAPVSRAFLNQGQFDHSGAFGYPSTTADSEGRYELRDVAPGTLHLHANPPAPKEFSESTRAQERDEEVLESAPGSRLVWDAVLEAGPTIAGRVVYADGEPMQYAFVSIEDEAGVRQAIQTDEEGRFRFLRVPVAPHKLRVQLWDPPKEAGPVEQLQVWPDTGELLLTADYTKPTEEPDGSVHGRVDDAGKRRLEGRALSVVLIRDPPWATRTVEVVDSAFSMPYTSPGRYRPVLLAGEDPVFHGEWFELASGERRDLGTLVTVPPGSVHLRVVRDDSTAGAEPTVCLGLDGSPQERVVRPGLAAEQRIDNLTPGVHRVRLYGKGLAGEESSVEVREDSVAELEVRLRAGVLREFEIDLPSDALHGLVHVRAVDAHGNVLADFEENPARIGRPYRRKLSLPMGPVTLTAETNTGLAGRLDFEMTSLAEDQPPVRLELR
jgi:RNA polymerase sigma-70 factor (ECF subfamily)